MKSYKPVNLISIKVPDTQIYLKTTTRNRGFLNEYETRSKVCVHNGQNRLSLVFNDNCSQQTEVVTLSTTSVHDR